MSNAGDQKDGCQRGVVLPLLDNAVLDRILDIHGPENIEFNMSPMIKVIQDIVYKSNHFPDTISEKPTFRYEDVMKTMHESLAFKISVISCEILGSCYRTEDILETTLSMFTALSSYSWMAKGVVALAAFAVNYGQFRLVVEPRSTGGDDTATVVAFLEQVPVEMCETDLYKDITDLADALLLLIRTTWKLLCFYTKFIKPGAEAIKRLNHQLPTIISWIIQSIVVCQSLITNLAHTGYEYMSSSAEEWELSCLKQKVTSYFNEFEISAAEELANLFPKDNITVLKQVICSEEIMNMALSVGARTKHPGLAKVDTLEKKRVLLYLSTLDLDDAEIKAVERIHEIIKKSNMVLVWLPVLDKPEDWKEFEDNIGLFEQKRGLMPWHVVRKPQFLDPTIIAFIKNSWELEKKSKIMVFDSEGRLEKENALPMILVWGSLASPFTTSKEDELWRSEKQWNLELLLTVPMRADLKLNIEEDKYICLFGGEEVNWIEQFTELTEHAVKDSGVSMEMRYIGGSIPRNTEEIHKAKVAESWNNIFIDRSLSWLFWARIEVMFDYCLKRGINWDKDSGNPILEGLVTMRSFDKSRRGWAMICKGADKITRAFSDVMLKCFEEYDEKWKREVKGGEYFLEALKSRIEQNCETLYFPQSSEGIPEKKICVVCRRVMRKSFTFSCWGEDDAGDGKQETPAKTKDAGPAMADSAESSHSNQSSDTSTTQK
ncbi:PREDICTED: protein SIEVE ELEMENT OCCLUSION B-like [Ipomoea nil]|uniref:protein SIEVE ELEMENT OCCLUSION B-like n=1 Tax=Ipomoea nil TaxID=35883 RepID=UPI000901CB2F|nr:PREDICTED: protein SIEVE ELEMENT OCCLUSION B-like [Ipomoea nil]